MGRTKGTPASNKGKTKYPIIDGKKECQECHRMLPLSSYSKGTGPGDKQYQCKPCHSDYQKQYKARLKKREEEELPEVTEKQCSWCKGIFGPEAFNKHASRPDGLQQRCRNCSQITVRYYYYKSKPEKVTWEDLEQEKDRAYNYGSD